MPKEKIDQVTFEKTWNEAPNLTEAAMRLGVSRTYASNRAVRLRKEGVVLKKFPKREKTDYAALAEAVRGLA